MAALLSLPLGHGFMNADTRRRRREEPQREVLITVSIGNGLSALRVDVRSQTESLCSVDVCHSWFVCWIVGQMRPVGVRRI